MDRQNIKDRRTSRKETREERERVRDTERKKEREVRKDNGEEMGEIISFNIESMRVKSVGKVTDTCRDRRRRGGKEISRSIYMSTIFIILY